MLSWQVGAVKITCVVETVIPFRGQPLAGCDGGGAEDEPLALSALRQGGWYAHCVGSTPCSWRRRG
jgi:hypothetical protein